MNIKDAKKELDTLETRKKELEKIILRGDIKSLMKKVKNFSDLCKEINEDEPTEGDFDHFPKHRRRKMYLQAKLQIINEIFGFKPDWNNRNQYKWRPWFEKQASGWCFRSSTYGYCSIAVVGFYETQEISDWVGRTFLSEHTEYIEIQ